MHANGYVQLMYSRRETEHMCSLADTKTDVGTHTHTACTVVHNRVYLNNDSCTSYKPLFQSFNPWSSTVCAEHTTAGFKQGPRMRPITRTAERINSSHAMDMWTWRVHLSGKYDISWLEICLAGADHLVGLKGLYSGANRLPWQPHRHYVMTTTRQNNQLHQPTCFWFLVS